MKRSEMIQKLIEQFQDSAYLHIGKEEADAILMCIEDNGMEPPKIKKTINFNFQAYTVLSSHLPSLQYHSAFPHKYDLS